MPDRQATSPENSPANGEPTNPINPKGSPSKKGLTGRAGPQPCPVPITEAVALYPGQWILMRVTALDESRLPTAGEMLAREKSYKKIWKRLRELTSQPGGGEGPYYIFDAYHPIRSGDRLRGALASMAETGVPGAWRQW